MIGRSERIRLRKHLIGQNKKAYANLAAEKNSKYSLSLYAHNSRFAFTVHCVVIDESRLLAFGAL